MRQEAARRTCSSGCPQSLEDGFHGIHSIEIRARLMISAPLAVDKSKPAPCEFIAGSRAAEMYQRSQHLLVLKSGGDGMTALENDGDVAIQIR
jgi:hypothetical protein